MRITSPLLLILVGCASAPTECERVADWRDEQALVDRAATIAITGDCELQLTVTEITLAGAGFEAELPEVGDKVPGQDWVLEVIFTSPAEVPPGDYSADLVVEALGLQSQSPKILTWTEPGDSGDTSDTAGGR